VLLIIPNFDDLWKGKAMVYGNNYQVILEGEENYHGCDKKEQKKST
jgi:hypothetical protein